MLYARISGIASYLPDDILDNEMLSQMVDTNDEWITTRVGIKERRILKKDGAGSSYLGIQAVNKLIESTGINPEEIELVICATSNPDYRFPSTGSVIVEGCGLKNAYAYVLMEDGVEVELADGSGDYASGLIMSGSRLVYSIEIARYKTTLEVSIYTIGTGSENYFTFVPADMAYCPYDNPYYVG